MKKEPREFLNYATGLATLIVLGFLFFAKQDFENFKSVTKGLIQVISMLMGISTIIFVYAFIAYELRKAFKKPPQEV